MPLADAINGEALFESDRCEPKLTAGSDIVRDNPLPLSTETFSDWYDALIGKAPVGYAPAICSSRFKTPAEVLLRSRVPRRVPRKPASSVRAPPRLTVRVDTT